MSKASEGAYVQATGGARHLALAGLAVLFAFICNVQNAGAASVGTFGATRATSLATDSTLTGFRNLITGAGHTLSASNTLDAAYLDTLDIFITSAIAFGQGASAAEVTALTNWMNGGGTLVVTGEHFGFKDRYDSLLLPFGVTLTGVSSNVNFSPAFSAIPSDPYLANAVAGSVIPTSNHGWYSVLPGAATVLAEDMFGQDFAFRLAVGSGQLIGIAETYFMTNFADPGNAGQQFLMNAIELSEVAPGAVPLPAALPLFATGIASLAGLASVRRRRKRCAGTVAG